MKRTPVIVAFILTLGFGFFSGRLSSGNSPTQVDRDPGVRSRPTERPALGKPSAPGALRRLEIRTAGPEQVPQMVFRALEAGDPVLRTQLMAELLDRMDADNFKEMLAEVERVSNETGREHSEELTLLNIRAGQVAGAAAMEVWKAKNLKSDLASRTFYGWAEKDPMAARLWLGQQTDMDPDLHGKLLGSLLSGAVVHNPEDAGKLLASLPEAERMSSLFEFSNSMVDTVGKEGTIDWLKTLQQTDKDSEFTKKAATRVFDRLLWSGANRRNAASMVSDMERLSSVIPIDENWIVRGMGQIRDRRPIGGIELLDELAKSPQLKDQTLTDRAWDSAVGYAISHDRAAVDAWVAANSASPIVQKVSEMLAR